MVHYPDKSLCIFFHAGLNTQTRSHLPGDGPQGALCEVLQNNKSPFTVGVVEENLTLFVFAPALDFLPEPSQPLITPVTGPEPIHMPTVGPKPVL